MARSVNGFCGTFTTLAGVTAQYPPSEHAGCSANIGTQAPYLKAWCDGISWAGFTSAQVATLRLKQSLPRIGCMGDSIAALNTSAASYSYPASGWLNWAQARLGQPWYFPMANNFAISGTSTDVVNAAQLPLVLAAHASRPISRMFISTGTNDAGASLTVAQRKTLFATLFGTLVDAGITPVHIGILPRGNDGAMTAAKRQNIQLNEWMQWYATTKGGLEFIDCGAALANTANAFGNALTTLTDGTQLHPIDPGGFYIGQAIAAYYTAKGIAPGFRAANQAADTFDATDNPTGAVLFPKNPFMNGGGSGTAPTNFTISPATAVWNCANTRTLPNGQTRPAPLLTPVGAASHFLYEDAVATGAFDTEDIRTGDYVYPQAEVVLTGTANLANISLQLVENDGTTTVDSRVLSVGTGNIPSVSGSLTLTLRGHPVPIRAFSGSGNASVFTRLNVTTNASPTGTYQVNSFETRKWVGEV